MIQFELPDSAINRKVNLKLVKLLKDRPDLFYPEIGIEAVYGCPYGCIWNGGCINMPEEDRDINRVKKMFDDYAEAGVAYRLTFTNRCLGEEDLSDTYGNAIAELGNKRGNAVIVSTDLMQNYICETYGYYEIIQSVSRVFKSKEEVEKSMSQYYTCLPVWMNNNWSLLRTTQNLDKAIILVNEYCPVSNCDFCEEHYNEISRYMLKQTTEKYVCKRLEEREKMKREKETPVHIVTPNDYEKYTELGIKHFKINGRASDLNQIVDLYCNYFAKKEYEDLVGGYLLNE